MIAPTFEKLSKEHTDVVFCKFDVDEVEDLAASLGIEAMPTVCKLYCDYIVVVIINFVCVCSSFFSRMAKKWKDWKVLMNKDSKLVLPSYNKLDCRTFYLMPCYDILD